MEITNILEKHMTRKQIRLNTLQKINDYLRDDLPRLSAQSSRSPGQVLEYTKQLLTKLGNPEKNLNVVHVSGTTGKGSVCYMIDAILRAHNKKSTLIVSPHVYEPRERLQINGQLAPEKLYIQLVNTVLTAAHSLDDSAPSYFGIITAISLLGASIRRSDYVIIEAGLGGPHELTNVAPDKSKYCVITKVINDSNTDSSTTFKQIARAKTQIITPGSMVIALSQNESVNHIISDRTEQLDIPVVWVEETQNYQIDNELLALNASQTIAKIDNWMFDEDVARTAAERIYIPGRYEKRDLNNKLVILDGAHSPANLSGLVQRLQTDGHDKLNVVFSLGRDKDIEHCLRTLQQITNTLVITEYFRDMGYSKKASYKASEIKAVADKLHFSNTKIEPSASKAVRLATKEPGDTLVTGSFYLLSGVDRVF